MKKIALLTFLIILSVCDQAKAQLQGQEYIDSLKRELKEAKVDTTRINLLNELSYNLMKRDFKSAQDYASEALQIAQKIDWENGLSNSFNMFGIIEKRKGNYDEAFEYYKKAKELRESIGDKNAVAAAFNNIGSLYKRMGNNEKAREYFDSSLAIRNELNDEEGKAAIYMNLGNLMIKLGDYDKALSYYYDALEIFEKFDKEYRQATVFNNIGIIFRKMGELDKAYKYYQKSLKIREALNDRLGIAKIYQNLGNIHVTRGEHDEAIEYFKKTIEKLKGLNAKNSEALVYANLAKAQSKIGNYIKAVESIEKSLEISKQIDSKSVIVLGQILASEILLNYGKYLDEARENSSENLFPISNSNKIYSNALKYAEDAVYNAESYEVNEYLFDAYLVLANSNYALGNYKKAFDNYVKHDKLKDSVYSKETSRKISELEARKENEIKDQKLKVQELQIERSKNERWGLIAGLFLLGIIVFLIYYQRKKSEKLLLNILPVPIAKRLKKKENPIADHFDNVSIVFIDIVGFTRLASEARAERVVEVLDSIFKQFDEIATKHNLEKIKTIGDSYMAAAGLPVEDPNHATNTANFALEVKDKMTDYKTEDDTPIQFRIGIACGEVVAGVIGNNKFIYDLWGDTVNIASRMESSGTPGKIQVTEEFKDALDNDYKFEKRGEIDIKGKGLMRTYYLKGKSNA